ncbi:MAG: Arc family DNA binding domain-containing protein [Candidatus Omnitrophica bacterium]|nr:Arc family DNA binding domain-containing protein [Candidatus Omnitrophota bacterium]
MAERKAYLLRIDPVLWNDLEAWAADELRSVNGQIEYLLRQAVLKRKGALSRQGPAGSNPGKTNEGNRP